MLADPRPALVPFGWDERVLALFNESGRPEAAPARVVRVERSASVVVAADGVERSARSEILPVVGDWVVLDGDEVVAVLTRWSELSRLDPDGSTVQVLAANVDLVFITAPSDRLGSARVERELAVAWESGARPVVVVTKTDLAGADDVAALEGRLVGVDVVPTSIVTGAGIEVLRAMLQPGRSAVLLGPSGAGKSSLVNALLGAEVLATGAVRDGDARGRHTTTSRQLVCVPGGGVLIDTPGLRSLGLVGDGEGLGRAFPEIDALAAQCRFDDCHHDVEPGCAVLAAVGDGVLDQDRLASYRKLEREGAAQARRSDPLLRRADVSVWKSRTKEMRANYKRRSR
ncbi:MAG: ribosome small subunit-dependent GTPase A [Acidimicrobiia bacterium]